MIRSDVQVNEIDFIDEQELLIITAEANHEGVDVEAFDSVEV